MGIRQIGFATVESVLEMSAFNITPFLSEFERSSVSKHHFSTSKFDFSTSKFEVHR